MTDVARFDVTRYLYKIQAYKYRLHLKFSHIVLFYFCIIMFH